MSFIPTLTGNVVSTANTYNGPVAALGTFTGEPESTLRYTSSTITIGGGTTGAGGTLFYEFSPDGVAWPVSVPTAIADLGGGMVPMPLRTILPWFRVRYVNGPVPVAALGLLVQWHHTEAGQLTRVLGQGGISDSEPVLNVRAVIAGKVPSGAYHNVDLTTNRELRVALADVRTQSTVNATETPLAALATFTGEWEATGAGAVLRSTCKTNVAGTLTVDWWEGTGTPTALTVPTVSQSVALESPLFMRTRPLVTVGEWYRVRVINGATPQLFLSLSSSLIATGSGLQTVSWGDDLAADALIPPVRAAMAAKDATTGLGGNLMSVLASGIRALYADITDRAGRLLGIVSISGTVPVSAAALPLPAGAATESTLALRAAASQLPAALVGGKLAVDVVFPATQPVSAAALPLPAGAATEATLALIRAKTDNLDVALSTRAVTGLTDAQLRATPVPVSGSFFQATQPVSATSLPLPTGATTAAAQTTGNASLSSIDAKAPALVGGRVPVDVSQRTTASVVSVTAAANTALTATLPAVAGQFHYITRIEVTRVSTAALAGTAALVVTTTNLPGALAWSVGNAMTAGGTVAAVDQDFPLPLKSTTVNTATTIVCPAGGAAVLWRINVFYYLAP